MSVDRVQAIDDLLVRAESAHGVYERTELDGVYDEDWPRWYAGFAVENGIGSLVGRELAADELAVFLERTYAELERTDPKPDEPWSTHTARRIATEL